MNNSDEIIKLKNEICKLSQDNYLQYETIQSLNIRNQQLKINIQDTLKEFSFICSIITEQERNNKIPTGFYDFLTNELKVYRTSKDIEDITF
tara:strand:- start:53 stop:328 length:276 start_codon:yes stop_codon:yes gene_type:complete